jgi:small subunit ribosomal protein S16
MLVLKLQRIGKKHQAHFRLVVGERRIKLNGRQLEYLGWYDPHADKMAFKKERVLHWLNHGAQKTNTVHNLLITAGIIKGRKIAVHN